MSWQRWWLAAGLSAAISCNARSARAEAPPSCKLITRANLVSCALTASLSRKAGRAAVEAAEARATAAEPWFPSAPMLSLTGARRSAAGNTAFNASATLAVELEIAGQRGARRRAATAGREAEERNADAIARAIAAAAWRTYFGVLAGEEASELLDQLEDGSKRVWEAARAAAARGLLPGVEADVAEAAYVGVLQRRIAARAAKRRASAELATLLRLDDMGGVAVEGTLEPLPEAEWVSARHFAEPAEAAALEAEGRAFSARAEALESERVPNPTLSLFAQRDGFDEDVFGLGLAFPLPLPEPVGRMHVGEVAENEALAHRARLLAADSRRRAKADLLQALADYAAAREGTRVYTKERLERSQTTLASLAAEVEAARIGARDAVVLQQPLFELLLGAIEARKALCIASAEVARAAGGRLEGGGAR